LNQTYSDFELLIVDNNSDNTDQIIKKYLGDPRVSYDKNQANLGFVCKWNRCPELGNGEHIKFLCADDKFHPNLLETYVPIMDHYFCNPNVSLISCDKQAFGRKT
jgi:glycosyltransferase involved in cell wall biosynthesis